MGGSRFNRSDPELNYLVEKLNQVFRAGEVGGTFVEAFPFLRHFTGKNFKFGIIMEGHLLVKKFIEKTVEEHKSTLDIENPRDFIDLYLTEMLKHSGDKETTYNEEQLVSLCLDLFGGGAEISTATVAFAVLLSTLHPEVMGKIHRELDSVVGQERLPSIDDRSKLVYTEAVLSEVFRFRGPSSVTVPHCAVKDTMIQVHHIPARTTVINNLYSIQLDAAYWGDPENFRPERFISSDGALRKDERLISFVKGRRACLGESLARMTIFLFFTALMQKFTFTLDPSVPVQNTEGIAGFTLGPPHFKVFAKSRS